MELPDEAVSYQFQSLLTPLAEEWTPAAEARVRHFLHPNRLKELHPRLLQARSQVAAEREVRVPAAEAQPLEPGFIDLPQTTLDSYKRKKEASDLGRVLSIAAHLRQQADRIVVVGSGSAHLPGRVFFEAIKSRYHNELPAETRLGVPRIYFAGQDADTECLQDLLDLLQVCCVDPESREERWAVVAISRSGNSLESLVALRVFGRDAVEYYGLRSEWLKSLFIGVTAGTSPLRELFKAQGHTDEEILTLPEGVGGPFNAFTPAGLLPAALMELDVRALLQGAAAMTRRFLEEPPERNPVLQFAAINYLMSEELGKPIRILSVWCRKLEALGQWYEALLANSLSKQGRGPTPLTLVQTRDLHARAQQLLEGPRDKLITHLFVKGPRTVPIAIGMADHNEDGLNALARKSLGDVANAANEWLNAALWKMARPASSLILPSLTEHTLGQVMQLLMLATVIEGRLMGINPYGEPGVETYRRGLREQLKA